MGEDEKFITPKEMIKVLRQYAAETHTIVRSTSDLSPLEIWLLIKLIKTKE